MKNLGERITIARKARGLSQERLADDAQINLRTLQRIEKGSSIPHGDTLQRIAGAIDIPIEELMNYGQQPNIGYIKMLHFSALVFVIFPYGNIFLPLMLWLSRKNDIRNLSYFAKNLINFQITWSIVLSFPFLWMFTSWIFKFQAPTWIPYKSPFAFIAYYYIFFYLLNFIYIIIVGSVISDKVRNYFPIRIKFIR